jgi:putative nucleotidyltransferase with HDIG domain
LKRNHSIRVAALSGLIGKRLGLSEDEILLARTIGLLHDVARFEQYTRFRTFRDPDSFDHGDYGAQMISDLQPLRKIDEESREIIKTAIWHHNKARIPSDLSERQLLHTKLIRDTDKLDIIYLTCNGLKNGTNNHNFSGIGESGPISPEILRSLITQKFVDYNSLKTGSDFQLLKIGWVYDLNFTPSMALLHKRNHLEILKKTLPDADGLPTILEGINDHLREKLADSM